MLSEKYCDRYGDEDENENEDHHNPDPLAFCIKRSDLIQRFSIRSSHQQGKHSPEPPDIPEETQQSQTNDDEGENPFRILWSRRVIEKYDRRPIDRPGSNSAWL